MDEKLIERATHAMDRIRGGGRREMKAIGEMLDRGSELADARAYAEARDAIASVMEFLAEVGGPPRTRSWTFALGDADPRFVIAVYMTEPLETRAKAVADAVEIATRAKGGFSDALDGANESLFEEVARHYEGPLPELDAFLPSWIEELESRLQDRHSAVSRDAWQRHLDDARGLNGDDDALGDEALAKPTLARLEAWTLVAFKSGDMKKTFAALEQAAAALPSRAHLFLDQAARVAQALGPETETAALEAAMRAKPDSLRCLRWMLANATFETTMARAAVVRDVISRRRDGDLDELRVLVDLMTGDMGSAVATLAKTKSLPALGIAAVVASGALPKDHERNGFMGRYLTDILVEDHDGIWVGRVQYWDEPATRLANIGLVLARSGLSKSSSREDRATLLSAIKSALAKNGAALAVWKAHEELPPDPPAIGTVVARCVAAERAAKTPAWVDDLHALLARTALTKGAAISLRKQVDSVLRKKTAS